MALDHTTTPLGIWADMVLNKIFRETPELNRALPVPSGTKQGTPLLVEGVPVVTLTARTGVTATETYLDGTSVTYSISGASVPAGQATCAFDGTFEFAVAGATTSTASLVKVYITSGGVLTLTQGTNTLYGVTDYPTNFRKEAVRAPVRIGA